MVLMQLMQQLQVLLDEQELQHLHDEFFRRFQFPLLVQDLHQVLMQVCELAELHKHQLVVKLALLQLVPEVVSLVPEVVSLVRQPLVPEVELRVRQPLVPEVELQGQRLLRQRFQLIQDALPLQLLYQLRHQ
jgi:hypothetical protein